MNNVLVVIDVQKEYEEILDKHKAKWQSFIDNIIEKIIHFKNNNLPIILVSHSCCGEIIPEIVDTIKNYSNVFYVGKTYFNGAKPIMKCIDKNKINCDTIHVSGLYSNCCVYRTVKGLTDYNQSVILSEKYCYDHIEFPTNKFNVLPNICIV